MNCTGKNCIMQYDKVDPATCPCVSYCPNATPPKTNGDRIRQMTDEELAKWIRMITQILTTPGGVLKKPLIEWLKEEVKDERT